MAPETPDPALSHSVGPGEPLLLEQTIGDNLDATVARVPDRDALVDRASGVRMTYAELGAEVDRLARGLVGAGIAKGDRVGIWAPNCAEWVLTQYATAKVGAILVNINPAYRSHELTYVLGQAGIRMMVIAPAFKSSDYVAMVDAARDECPQLEQVVVIGQESWGDLLARADEVSPERLTMVQAELEPGDPINIQYTSGTTGFPKGATLSHHNILNNGYLVGELCRYTEQDRICIPVPFYHCFGMVMGNLAATTHGACMVIPAPGFDPALTLAAVAEERCTSLYGVPTMFIAEWALPDLDSYDLSSVRTGIMAGSPCPASMMTKLIEAGDRGDDDLLRHDGDVAGVDPDPHRRLVRAQGGHGGCRAPTARDQGRRPRHPRDPPARRGGGVLHQGLLGDARLLERSGEDRRGARRRLDAHR